MAFKNYNPDKYDQTNDELGKRRQQRKKSAEEVRAEYEPETVSTMPKQPSAEQVRQYAVNAKKSGVDPTKPMSAGEYEEEPVLYTGTGKNRKINPDYDTSIGQDILGGAFSAMSQQNGNPFHDLGLAAGGAIGGAFSKNIRGKQKHAQDVIRVRDRNHQIDLRSQAQQRLDDFSLRQQREQRLNENAQNRQVYREKQAAAKDKKSQNDIDLKIMKEDPNEENRQMAAENFSKRNNTQVSPEMGRTWKQVQAGDYLTMQDNLGNIKVMTDSEGQPVTTLTTTSYLNILKSVEALSDYDDDAMKNALGEAGKLLKEGKVPVNPKQMGMAQINLAKTILKEQGKKTGRVTIGDETHEIEIPQLNHPETGKPLAPKQEESQFMPPLAQDVVPTYDATKPDEQAPTEKAYPLTFTHPETKKEFHGREVSPPSSVAGKKVPEGTTYPSKDGKKALLFKGGKWYEIIQ